MFPQIEPIPLPAPVWLFKALEVVTVSLHFVAVQLLLGGLLIGTCWALVARRQRDEAMLDAAGNIASRLPVLMVYVINFGVPPLLFAQVLYGQAIYTSSVLIGAVWLSVILLLMLAYSMLYLSAGRASKGQNWSWPQLVALATVGCIALIYSSNMTLMIRPEAWTAMYQHDPFGLHLNSGDATVWPRWLFMIAGGIAAGGVGSMILGMLTSIADDTAQLLRTWGPRLATVGIMLQILLAVWVFFAQPQEFKEMLANSTFYRVAMFGWLALAVLFLAAAVWVQLKGAARDWRLAAIMGAALFLEIVAMVVARGGIRDLTLLAFGMDVWDRRVEANWIVTAAFLILFVLGLVVMGWLASVLARAKKVEKRYV